LNVQPLPDDHAAPSPFLGGWIRTVRCTHGEGLIGRLMEHGVGYLIEIPGQPSLYLAGDTVLTPTVRDFVLQYQPRVSVVPAGGARFDVGNDVIMGVNDVLEFTRLSLWTVVANHLVAISHCPVTGEGLANAATEAGIAPRLLIPVDGQVLDLS